MVHGRLAKKLCDLEVFTCTVGKKPSAAASYVHEAAEVQELMNSLLKVSTCDQKFFSSGDLTSYSNRNTAAEKASLMRGGSFEGALTKSRSLSEMGSSGAAGEVQTEVKISTTLSQCFLRLGILWFAFKVRFKACTCREQWK